MKLIKALGLAAVAAVMAMALIGTSSAFAEDEIVICKELIQVGKLCPTGKLWPKESVFLALSSHAVLHTSSGEVLCKDSIVEGKTLAEIGNPLPFDLTKLEFGVLPTPKLGAGCEGICTEVHTAPPYAGQIEVTGEDDFWFKSSGEATLLHCTFLNLTCVYGSNNIKSLIKHDGEHPLHEGKNLPLIKIEAELTRNNEKSSGFCPATGNWLATYVLTLVHFGAESGLGWPALDVK